MLKGTGVSQGYAKGKAFVLKAAQLNYSGRKFTNAQTEKERLKQAVDSFCSLTREHIKKLNSNALEEAEILEGHIAMAEDPFVLSQMETEINSGAVAEKAVDTVYNDFYKLLSASENELTRQRTGDVKDVKQSLLSILLNSETTEPSNLPKGAVIVAEELTPSLIAKMEKSKVSGIVTERGGATSHSAILARAAEIPAVFALEAATELISDGVELIVDGEDGTVIISPTAEQVKDYCEKKRKKDKENEVLKKYINISPVTKSGAEKRVYGNAGSVEDVERIFLNGGEGVGLFRTEFIFMNRESEPTETEQFEIYRSVAVIARGKEVIIRTLDVGGDKDIEYLNTHKAFSAERGISYSLKNKAQFKKQLRALLRAAAYGNIKILLPFVSSPGEIKDVKKLLNQCERELESEGEVFKSAPLGVMIETSRAVLVSDLLAKEADFFSIGTNDLTASITGADRYAGSEICDLFEPSVQRAIKTTVKNAAAADIPVEICGEAAADERYIPSLVEWGLEGFSVTPSEILKTKKLICECE